MILLQNYQILNFTGFRKVLKKHDRVLKNSDTQNIAVIVLKFEQWFYHRRMHRKGADGMANNVDPDQTAPSAETV